MSTMQDVHKIMMEDLNRYTFGVPPAEEVTAFDPWDFVEVSFDPTVGGPRRFYDPENKSEVLNSKIRLFTTTHEWQPWTEAIDELKALVASWRARGWTMQADEIESPKCGDDDCDCDHERSIYDEMGVSVPKQVPHEFPLSVCRFFKAAAPENGLKYHVDSDLPADRVYFLDLSRLPPVPPPAFFGLWDSLPGVHYEEPKRLNQMCFGDGDGSQPIYERIDDVGTWTCPEHLTPPTYPLTVEKCEVCGTPRPKG